jgi:predicted DNA-binding protein with PD1-like motif
MRTKIIHDDRETTFAVVFEKGEEAMESLLRFARDHRITAAHLTAIGAFSEVTLGFFDPEKRSYKKIPVTEQVEVVSLAGNIAMAGADPKVHAHVVVSTSDGRALGGHLLQGRVWPTLEVIVQKAPEYLRRVVDPETGLPLIQLD